MFGNINFYNWLVGFIDGDGCFTIDRQKNGLKWNLVFKISQSKINAQLIYFIKKNLGIGHITIETQNITQRIRNLNHFNTVIFPIFDKYNLNTSKYLDYILIKDALRI